MTIPTSLAHDTTTRAYCTADLGASKSAHRDPVPGSGRLGVCRTPSPQPRAAAARAPDSSGQSGINPRGYPPLQERKSKRNKLPNRKNTRNSPAHHRPGGGAEEERAATGAHLVSRRRRRAPPPLVVRSPPNSRFGLVRFGCVPARRCCIAARGAGRAGFLVGDRGGDGGGMLCGLRRLDPVKKAEEAGIPDATATGGRREVRLGFSSFLLSCPVSPVSVGGRGKAGSRYCYKRLSSGLILSTSSPGLACGLFGYYNDSTP
jgi:hypothetical protein